MKTRGAWSLTRTPHADRCAADRRPKLGKRLRNTVQIALPSTPSKICIGASIEAFLLVMTAAVAIPSSGSGLSTPRVRFALVLRQPRSSED